jgi:hypothetical protein
MATTFSNKCDILAELWLNYKDDEDFAEFVKYNDLGLPLAYVLATEIVEPTPKAEAFVNETFDLLLAGLSTEDTEEGFSSLDDVILLGDEDQEG